LAGAAARWAAVATAETAVVMAAWGVLAVPAATQAAPVAMAEAAVGKAVAE